MPQVEGETWLWSWEPGGAPRRQSQVLSKARCISMWVCGFLKDTSHQRVTGQNVQDHGSSGRPELTWSFS